MQKPYEEIAPRLRALREALNLEADDLAARAGVTAEKVLSYESGESEIPVSYLYLAAQACGVDLTVLLSGGDAHLKEYSLVRSGKGLSVERRKDYQYKSLAYRFTHRRMEPFLVTVPPKEEQDLTYNSHPGQEFIHLLDGSLEIRIGENVLTLEPGDSLYFNSHLPHALRGLDGKEARFLDVIL
ncbi:MAG: helix-turn-helix domain-containing protein [Desulfovibrionales bacterium]